MHNDYAIMIEKKLVGQHWDGRGGFMPVAIVEQMMQGTLEATWRYFDGKAEGTGPSYAVSAHYGVGQDGRVWQFVEDENTAWSNGILQNPDPTIGWLKEVADENLNCNLVTLSIQYEGFSGQPLTEAQYEAAVALHRQLIKRWEIEVDNEHILGHNRLDSVERFQNPGPAFPWLRLLRDLMGNIQVTPVEVFSKSFATEAEAPETTIPEKTTIITNDTAAPLEILRLGTGELPGSLPLATEIFGFPAAEPVIEQPAFPPDDTAEVTTEPEPVHSFAVPTLEEIAQDENAPLPDWLLGDEVSASLAPNFEETAEAIPAEPVADKELVIAPVDDDIVPVTFPFEPEEAFALPDEMEGIPTSVLLLEHLEDGAEVVPEEAPPVEPPTSEFSSFEADLAAVMPATDPIAEAANELQAAVPGNDFNYPFELPTADTTQPEDHTSSFSFSALSDESYNLADQPEPISHYPFALPDDAQPTVSSTTPATSELEQPDFGLFDGPAFLFDDVVPPPTPFQAPANEPSLLADEDEPDFLPDFLREDPSTVPATSPARLRVRADEIATARLVLPPSLTEPEPLPEPVVVDDSLVMPSLVEESAPPPQPLEQLTVVPTPVPMTEPTEVPFAAQEAQPIEVPLWMPQPIEQPVEQPVEQPTQLDQPHPANWQTGLQTSVLPNWFADNSTPVTPASTSNVWQSDLQAGLFDNNFAPAESVSSSNDWQSDLFDNTSASAVPVPAPAPVPAPVPVEEAPKPASVSNDWQTGLFDEADLTPAEPRPTAPPNLASEAATIPASARNANDPLDLYEEIDFSMPDDAELDFAALAPAFEEQAAQQAPVPLTPTQPAPAPTSATAGSNDLIDFDEDELASFMSPSSSAPVPLPNLFSNPGPAQPPLSGPLPNWSPAPGPNPFPTSGPGPMPNFPPTPAQPQPPVSGPLPSWATPPAPQPAPAPVQQPASSNTDGQAINWATVGGGAIAVDRANVRIRPSYEPTTVSRVANFGQRLHFDGWVEGPELRGSTRWYHIAQADGGGWIHSTLVRLDQAGSV